MPSQENLARLSADEKDVAASTAIDHHLDEKATVEDNDGEKAVAPTTEAAGEQEDPNAEYPKGLALGLLTLGLCLTTFVVSARSSAPYLFAR